MKGFFRQYPLRFAALMAAAVLYYGAIVGISPVLQFVVDYTTAGDLKRAVLWGMLYVPFCAAIYGIYKSAFVRMNQKVIAAMRGELVRRLLSMDDAEFHRHDETDYISLFQNDVKKIEDGYLDICFGCIGSAVQLILATVVMTRYSPVFTAAMFGMTAVMMIIPAMFSKRLSEASEALSEAGEEFTYGISETVMGYDTVKTFHKESYSADRFSIRNRNLKGASQRSGLLKQANDGLANSMAMLMQIVICLLAGWYIYRGRLSFGSMMGIIQVSGSMTQPLFTLFALIPALRAFKPLFEKIETYTQSSGVEVRTARKTWDMIELEHIRFTYPGREKAVFEDAVIRIRKGGKYLIIGESGCGKSTLTDMIAGKISPDGGRILIDGGSPAMIRKRLRALTAGVWQKEFVFCDSIENNIRLGGNDAEKYEEAVRLSGLSEVIREKGHDFIIGANGERLSGGQKQRIAIARALFSGKDILILDEGLSALDTQTAETVEAALLNKKDLTLISVSHRISEKNVGLYDVIYRVADGKIQTVV